MVWRSRVAVPVLFSLGSVLSAPTAYAAEAYLCGPDKVVYVEVGELEEKKRTDPCIASYFGLTIAAANAANSAKNSTIAKKADVEIAPEAPKAKPALKPAQPKFSSLSENKAGPPTRAVREASLRPVPEPSPETDFRNVKVLNASSPDAAWYRHIR